MRPWLAVALVLVAGMAAPSCGDDVAGASGGSANVSTEAPIFASGAAAPLLRAPRDEAPSERETVLGWSLALIAALGCTSFLLSGRVGARVHVALSLLSVLVAVFGLYLLLGSTSAFGSPLAATAALAALLAVLKLMSRVETTLKPKGGPPG